MIDPHLGKHFLRRLRHHAEADAIDHAVEIGILSEELRSIDGRPVRTFAPGPLAARKPEAVIVRLIRHQLRAGCGTQLDDAFGAFVEPSDASSAGTTLNAVGEDAAIPSVKDPVDTAVILRAAREAAGPPRAREVATLMLLASSLQASGTSIEDVLDVLRSPNPIVTVTGLVKGFEDGFMVLLTGGIVLPGTVGVCRGDEFSRHNGFRFNWASEPRWRIITFEGDRFDSDSEARVDRQVGVAAESVYPILGIAESEDNLPRQLRHAARLNLICGPIDMEIIRETMRAVLGEVPEGIIGHHDASMLTLTDMALAIRPGMAAGRVLTLLQDLAPMRREAREDEDGGTSDKKTGRTSGSARTARGNPGSGSETIEPAALTGTDADRFIPRVEHSSGYGDAKGWALALKDDLALWRAGTLAWEDMSVKLLLSGPPGTGKTTFARALCNTLQVPLIVSSVATWMEPGYLGDVLKRMSAAFAEAEAAKPSILFIDEIDGIGGRGTHGEWDSYWDSVVGGVHAPNDRNHDGETAAAVLRSLALKARGLRGADIERLVREARQKARRQNRTLAFADLFDILASARPERSHALGWRIAVHEAGHAVAMLFFDLGIIDTVSIDGPDGGYIKGRIPGGREETEEYFGALIAVTRAGRTAEQELLGSAAGGSGGGQESDLAKATGLALAMETALGFAREAPLLYRPAEDRSSLLAYNLLIAERVDARLEEAYGEARSLVRSNRDAVYSLAEVLIDTTRWRGGTGGGDRESEEVNRAAARAGMMEEAIIAMMAERRQLWVRWWNPYRQAVSTCLQPDSICNDLRYCDSG